MQKLAQIQSLQQKLSPQQIQFIKLLQVPTAELDARIEQELEINPALEEGPEDLTSENESEMIGDESGSSEEAVDISDYLQDDYSGYKMQGDGFNQSEEEKESPLSVGASFHEQLLTQLGFLELDNRTFKLARQIIGSLDEDGYLRRELISIVNDLAFTQSIASNEDELEQILFKIQNFDPAGVGARDLRECLLLQLERNDPEIESHRIAYDIVDQCFEEFTKKHYEKISRKLGIENPEILKDALNLIVRCNPKPGGSVTEESNAHYLIPDFLLIQSNGKLELTLNSRNAPELRVSRSYADMFDTYDKSDKKDKKLKEAVSFIRQKLDAAKWFIDAIKQRQNTLINTMEAILHLQFDFFLEGDESRLKPMILKDVADKIQMDISTVSRVVNSKSIQTEFGIYPLKYFFSEGIATDSGEDVSSREVKSKLKEMIEAEDKRKPLSDDKLEKLLADKGYSIARRTVAKYREQLNIPVARLRKEI